MRGETAMFEKTFNELSSAFFDRYKDNEDVKQGLKELVICVEADAMNFVKELKDYIETKFD